MKYFTQAFRWYGPNDPVTLSHIRQCGATHIVTALHHIPNGEIWTDDEIIKRKNEVAQAGLTWSVVESLPVTDDIKTQTGNMRLHIENYKISLSNLAKQDIKIVTYNFMPVLDWTRTDLQYQLPEGYYTLRFNRCEAIAFDLFILKRPAAYSEFSAELIEAATKVFSQMTEADKARLTENILKGLPGSECGYTLEKFREMLSAYSHITDTKLKQHQYYFLNQIMPVAEVCGIKMAVHPDDPPYSLFGLPRVVSSAADLEALFRAEPSTSNGLCFCTGSLGVSAENNLLQMANAFKERVHFVHFRSTQRDADGNFYEANHLEGDAQIPKLIKVLIQENQLRETPIPFRPDHGYQMLDDINKTTYPGYSCIGRMKGLAEIRGLEKGIITLMEEANYE